MTRTIVFLMMLMSVLPSDGSAQAVPSPGDRIRIKQVDGPVLTGTLAAWSAETIQLSADSGRVDGTIAILRSEITTLERQQGTRSKSNVVVVLSVVGLLAGAAIAWATLGGNECGFIDSGCEITFGVRDVARVAQGAVVGGGVGALIGSAFRTENWVIVPLIEVVPTGQGTSASVFGFGLHARVGLPW